MVLMSGVYWIGLRAAGGWRHLLQTRRELRDRDSPEWRSLAPIFRGWFWAAPAFLLSGLILLVGGLISLLLN